MEEQWKIYREFKKPLQIYYISDRGNVRLKTPISDDILTIGKGLYVENNKRYPNIKIVGISEDIYRIVWKLFKGDIPKWYQIHHLDYNHTNNSLDNLVCLNPKDHGYYHSFQGKLEYNGELNSFEQQCYNKYKQSIDLINYYNSLVEYKDKYINDWNIYIRKLRIDLLELEYKEKQNQSQIKKIKKQQLREEQKQLREEQKQLDIQNKLESGEYKVNSKGKLYKVNKQKWTDERREKTMNTRYNNVYNDPEWRKKVSDGNKRYQQCKHELPIVKSV